MAETAMTAEAGAKVPWHLWVVGIVSLLWNAAGAWTIMSAQSGAPMDMDATEIAYYAAQPAWLVAVVDVVLISATLAALALLWRSRWAPNLYTLSLAGIGLSTLYELFSGTALLLRDQGWLILFCVTTGLAIFQLLYAVAMRRRGALR